ncbi:MAG: tRNA preQ1(34) S-adenosylmethionine ribosyltransferase-isomerase QueA [Anaerolineales bacterium]|nr:tRNA preQ1(34) S-adenosylmethionine ribosyltransferase-isomerase QueA [Anaerolineales bacterium]
MKTSDFDYHLPPEYIAQTPVEPRDASRLLILDRQSGDIQHAQFNEIGNYLRPGDLFVVNETRVIAARLFASKESTGGKVEILLLHSVDEQTWEALVGGKGLTPGKHLYVSEGLSAEILAVLGGARRLVRFSKPLDAELDRIGHVPLPPYIHRPIQDPERYQTVYARLPGSAAAPTAGLHFTPHLMESLEKQGFQFVTITLHVGLDTFAPVTEDDPRQHQIHTEWCQVPLEAARAVNQARAEGRRIVAVGTTSVRSLESAARHAAGSQTVAPYEGSTDLFILPGFRFQSVDALVTNFHLPRSTLLMLVSAYAGRERILAAYQTAIAQGYRFYSFGDAMLIL